MSRVYYGKPADPGCDFCLGTGYDKTVAIPFDSDACPCTHGEAIPVEEVSRHLRAMYRDCQRAEREALRAGRYFSEQRHNAAAVAVEQLAEILGVEVHR